MKTTRIGPRMLQVIAYVSHYPGCVKMHAARYVAPHGGKGLQYGYNTVNRCLAHKLIRRGTDPNRSNVNLLYPIANA